MGITIESIKENECFAHTGDVHVTGNVGKKASITIQDGNLIIDGNVENNVKINLVQENNNSTMIINNNIFINNFGVTSINTGKTLTVKGSVGNEVTFSSHNASYIVEGTVGNQCRFKTHNGDINTGNIGENTVLKSHNGDISSQDVNQHSSLTTHNGDVHAGIMGEHTQALSHHGNVKVDKASSSTKLDTYYGNVYENGIQRKKDKKKYAKGISTGGTNMSFIGGRIIVNGKDITDIVNNTSNNNSQSNEQPIRYTRNNK